MGYPAYDPLTPMMARFGGRTFITVQILGGSNTSERQSASMARETNRDFQVCLFGAQPNVSNLGVRALTHSLISLILESRPDAWINLLIGSRTRRLEMVNFGKWQDRIKIVNHRLSPRSELQEHLVWILFLSILYRIIPIAPFRAWIRKMNAWIGTLCESDYVGDIRGGDSFSDYYGLYRLIIGSTPCLIAILLKRPLVFLPQTYGPYESSLAKRIAGFLLARASRIYTRDRESIDVIKRLVPRRDITDKIKFCPDVAFTLRVDPPQRVSIEPSIPATSPRLLIGFNVSGLLFIGGYTHDNMFKLKDEYGDAVRAVIEGLLEKSDCHLLLLPHVMGKGGESDSAACSKVRDAVAEEYRTRLHLLQGEYDQNQIKSIIGQCDFFIGSRMHACIAALSQQVPAIGLAYSHKFHGVFKSMGVEDMVIDARSATTQELVEHCLTRLEQRDIFKARLTEYTPIVQALIRTTFAREFQNMDMREGLTPVVSQVTTVRC